jgi:hypothetical protein
VFPVFHIECEKRRRLTCLSKHHLPMVTCSRVQGGLWFASPWSPMEFGERA